MILEFTILIFLFVANLYASTPFSSLDVNGTKLRVAGVCRPIVPNKLEATNTSLALTEDWSCQLATNVLPR